MCYHSASQLSDYCSFLNVYCLCLYAKVLHHDCRNSVDLPVFKKPCNIQNVFLHRNLLRSDFVPFDAYLPMNLCWGLHFFYSLMGHFGTNDWLWFQLESGFFLFLCMQNKASMVYIHEYFQIFESPNFWNIVISVNAYTMTWNTFLLYRR